MKAIFIARDGRLRASWRFLLGAAAFFGAELGSGIFAAVATHPLPPEVGAVAYLFVQQPLSLALMLAAFTFLLAVGDRVEHDRLAAQGLAVRGAWLRQCVDGVLLGAGLVTVCVVAMAVASDVRFSVQPSARALLAVALLAVLLAVAAMKEEVAFRGYPFQRLLDAGGDRWGPVLAIAVVSVFFGLVHWNNPSRTVASTANTALIGGVLALAYLRTRALWLPFGLHFGWNFMLGVGFGLPVSGIRDFAVLVRGHATGPVWLTGGDYGIEGSAVATVVILLSVIPIVRLYRPPAAGLEVVGGKSAHAEPAGRIQS